MKAKDVIRKLEDDGWKKARHKGSHALFKHEEKQGFVIVPVHGTKKDVSPRVLADIEKTSGIQLTKKQDIKKEQRMDTNPKKNKHKALKR